MKMLRIVSLFFAGVAILLFALPMLAQMGDTLTKGTTVEKSERKTALKGTAQLNITTRYQFPSDVKGNFDQIITDHQGHRLFTCTEQHKSVDVFDLHTGKLIHSIGGV